MHHKIGAILVHNKEIIAKAHNRLVGQQAYRMNGITIDWSIHAEVDVLRKSLHYFHEFNNSKFTLYVARTGYRLARPCMSCLKLIDRFNITRIVYSNGYREIGEIFL